MAYLERLDLDACPMFFLGICAGDQTFSPNSCVRLRIASGVSPAGQSRVTLMLRLPERWALIRPARSKASRARYLAYREIPNSARVTLETEKVSLL